MADIGINTSTTAAVGVNATQKKDNSSLDKDAFLQLLVTQMQYQDPLEPTSNTEYMSQLAQFSSVEELQNISNTISSGQMLSLTGQYVIMNVPDSAGNISQVSGLVDYVTVTDGKTYFHINDNYYLSDYLDSVVSLDYMQHLSDQINKPDNNATQEDGKEQSSQTE